VPYYPVVVVQLLVFSRNSPIRVIRVKFFLTLEKPCFCPAEVLPKIKNTVTISLTTHIRSYEIEWLRDLSKMILRSFEGLAPEKPKVCLKTFDEPLGNFHARKAILESCI
jgi:hypothetical protein